MANAIAEAVGEKTVDRVALLGVGPFCDPSGDFKPKDTGTLDNSEPRYSYRQFHVSCRLLETLRSAPKRITASASVAVLNMHDNNASQTMAKQVAQSYGIPSLSCHRILLDDSVRNGLSMQSLYRL